MRKSKKTILKKIILMLNCALLVAICFCATAMPVQAASYPSVFLDTSIWGVDANNYAGDVISLKFTYFPSYKNEKLSLYVYDSDDNLMATANRNFSNYTIKEISYTVTWDTADYEPGTYKVVMEKHFYSFLEWRKTPTDSTWYVTLKDPASKPTDGWYLENSKWAYYENGLKLTSCWKADSNGWCYLGTDGYMLTDTWIQDSVGWCYLGSDGYCVTNQWRKDSVGWVYLDENGRMLTNAWVQDSVGWCYVGEDGYAVTNCWKQDSFGWCYLGDNGSMVKNAWINDGTGWYYINDSGYMVSNCWKQDSNGWCYLGASGRMVTNAWVNDTNGSCWLDSNGYWNGVYA